MIYIFTQLAAGIAGVICAHFMFDLTLLQTSENIRTGEGKWLAEMVATFGLVMTILGCVKYRPESVPFAVGLYITAGYWFTASTSFANPAVTVARAFTDTFSGIQLGDVPAFIVAQIIGAVIATIALSYLTTED